MSVECTRTHTFGWVCVCLQEVDDGMFDARSGGVKVVTTPERLFPLKHRFHTSSLCLLQTSKVVDANKGIGLG